jgi:hypothetical protein
MSDEKSVSEIASLIQRTYRGRFTSDPQVRLTMTTNYEYGKSAPTECFNAYLMYGSSVLASDSADSFEEAIHNLAYRLDVL